MQIHGSQNRVDHKEFFKPYMENISPYIEENDDVGVFYPIIIIPLQRF